MQKSARMNVLRKVERRRVSDGLTQAQVAAGCGFSQGQYSKMLRGEVQVGQRCAQSMQAWLASRSGRGSADARLSDGTARELLASIRRDLDRLTAIVTDQRAGSGRS